MEKTASPRYLSGGALLDRLISVPWPFRQSRRNRNRMNINRVGRLTGIAFDAVSSIMDAVFPLPKIRENTYAPKRATKRGTNNGSSERTKATMMAMISRTATVLITSKNAPQAWNDPPTPRPFEPRLKKTAAENRRP